MKFSIQPLNNQLLGLLGENSPEFIGISDLCGNPVYANPAAIAMVGACDFEEIRATPVPAFFVPEERDFVVEQVLPTVREAGQWQGELHFRHFRTGERIPVLYSVFRLDDPATGEPSHYVTITHDLREVRRTQNRDAFLLALDDAIRSPTDPEEIVAIASRMVVDYFFVARCEYAAVDCDGGSLSLVGDGDRERAGVCIPVRKGARAVACLMVASDDPRSWSADELDLLCRVANTCWETLDRAQILAKLRKKEYRLNLAQRAGRVGVFEWSMLENKVIWDPGIEALYGLPEGTFEGRLEDWSKRVVPEDVEKVLAGVRDSIAQRKQEYDYQFRAVWPDGTQHWLRGQSQFTYNDAGEATAMIGVNIDIDQQKRMQEALYHGQKMESIGMLAGGIAHDFNNLLVGILAGADLAMETIGPSHECYPMLQTVVDSGQRAADLTRQMLAYAGKGQFFIEAMDLSDIAAKAVTVVTGSIPETVTLRTEFGAVPTIESDAAQMQWIVGNLLHNAVEAVADTGAGIITVRTRTATVRTADGFKDVFGSAIPAGVYAVLEVEDNGHGIDPSIREKIFDPFFSTRFTGRGLGLAAVLGVVRRNHGAVQVESEVSRGSIFRIWLPAPNARIGFVEHAPPDRHGTETGKGTIVVIDDEPVVLRVARHALTASGYEVMTAESGQDGLQLVRDHPEIGLVLLDMSMPGISGPQVMQRLQSIRPGLQVVICSGYSQDEVQRRFAGLHVAGFLPKPFTTAQIVEQANSLIKR